MTIEQATLDKMQSAARPRLGWMQLSLRSLFLLLTVAAVAALFHEPLAAFGQSIWRKWYPEPLPPPPPPATKFFNCPGCGMG
jgi:hypothetical protein